MVKRMLTTRMFRWAILFSLLHACTATAEPKVTVTGGADPTAHNYTWTITHKHSAKLISVEIPHYRADIFTAPEGWSTEIINRQSLDFKPGECIAQALDSSRGLSRGQSAVFAMRAADSLRSEGLILLHFADGTETSVSAEIPTKPSAAGQWAIPASMGSMFAIIIAVRAGRARRRRNRQLREQSPPAPSSDDE